MASIPYVPLTKQHLYVLVFVIGATANVFYMLVEINKTDPIFQHYAQILANPLKAVGNPASSKAGKVFAMYRIHNPVVEGYASLWPFSFIFAFLMSTFFTVSTQILRVCTQHQMSAAPLWILRISLGWAQPTLSLGNQ